MANVNNNRNRNVNSISPQLREMLLAEAMSKASGFAIPYKALCGELSAIAHAQAARDAASRRDRATLWDTFKKALNIAANSGHSVESMRMGLELACSEAGIPGGSFRSYVNTLGQLFEDVLRARITVEEATALSISDARARYRVITPVDKVRRALAEATRDWNANELSALLNVAQGQTDEEVIETIEQAAEAHANDDADTNADQREAA